MDQSIQKELVTSETKTIKEYKIYSGVPLRIMKLLGTGLLPVEVARAVGVDDSYVSQLQKEPSFVQQVNELVTKTFAEQSEIDENYIAIEKSLSKKLKQSAEMMYNTDLILRTLKFANEAKRKMAPGLVNNNGQGPGNETIINHVTLILPTSVSREFILNPNNEIVGIAGEDLTTLPSANINKLVTQNRNELKSLPTPKIKLNGTGQTDPYGDL